jgi:hypothetical protein
MRVGATDVRNQVNTIAARLIEDRVVPGDLVVRARAFASAIACRSPSAVGGYFDTVRRRSYFGEW